MQSLVISNYKNFDKLTLENLANVNLIVGKNNVGKSTLLEAISIVAANVDVNWMKELLEMRGESVRFASSEDNTVEKEIERFVSLYHNRDMGRFFHSPIEFQMTDSQASDVFALKLVKYTEATETDNSGLERTVRRFLDEADEQDIENADVEIGFLSMVNDKRTLYAFGKGRSVRPIADKRFPFEYVRTNQISSDKNPALFDRLALTSSEKYIIKALQIIEPRIEALNYLKDDVILSSSLRRDERVPIVVLRDSSKRYRLSSMGDGINRVLTIILALLNCKDGVLLIDEFENGLHHSVQSQLWKIIFELSEELHIQVFATTHSEDAIKSFSENAQTKQNGKIIRLENQNSLIRVVEYQEKEELAYIGQNDIEIR